MAELLTDREVARLLKSCPRTVHNLVSRGEFPAPIKLGRMTRWRRSEIEAFLGSGAVVPMSAPQLAPTKGFHVDSRDFPGSK